MELSDLIDGLELKYVSGGDTFYGNVVEKENLFEIIWDDGELTEITKDEPSDHQVQILNNCKPTNNDTFCCYNGIEFNIKSIFFNDLNQLSHVILVNSENETKVVCGSELHNLNMKIICGRIK